MKNKNKKMLIDVINLKINLINFVSKQRNKMKKGG